MHLTLYGSPPPPLPARIDPINHCVLILDQSRSKATENTF